MAKEKDKKEIEQKISPHKSIKKPRKQREDKGQPRNADLYVDLINIYSVPRDQAEKEYGFKNLSDWCKQKAIPYRTAYDYTQNPDFKRRVSNKRFEYGFELEQDMLDGMRKGIRYGNPQAIELFLAYFKGWDKKQVIQNVQQFKIDDVYAAIKLLPETRQKYFFDLIIQIVTEAEDAARNRTIENNNSEGGRVKAAV